MALADVGTGPASARATVPSVREIYEAHATFVWRVLRAFGVRDPDLEDQVHEVFIVVHRKLGGFEGRSSVRTWLFAIAERVASDYRRSARVRRERVERDPGGDLAAEPIGEDEVARRQARGVLDAILDTMAPEQRVAFALFEIDGVPADEIAALAGCSVNTVHSRLRLARGHFERAMTRLRAKGWP